LYQQEAPFTMESVDQYSAQARREILSLSADPSMLQKRGNLLVYKGIAISRAAIVARGKVFKCGSVIRGVGRAEDVIAAAWYLAERLGARETE